MHARIHTYIQTDIQTYIHNETDNNTTILDAAEMLRGKLHSIVEIELGRSRDSHQRYSIRVLRHNFHEFD